MAVTTWTTTGQISRCSGLYQQWWWKSQQSTFCAHSHHHHQVKEEPPVPVCHCGPCPQPAAPLATFYLAVMYLQLSKLAYVVLGNATLSLAIATFNEAMLLFIEGRLQQNKCNAIRECIFWDITKMCLVLTIFQSKLDRVTAGRFLSLVVLKCLHWSMELWESHQWMTEEVFTYPGHANQFKSNWPKWYCHLPHWCFSHVQFYAFLPMAHCAIATDSPRIHNPHLLQLWSRHSHGVGAQCHGDVSFACCQWGHGGVVPYDRNHHYCPVGGMAAASDHDDDANNNDGNDNDKNKNKNENNQSPHSQQQLPCQQTCQPPHQPWKDWCAPFSLAIDLQAKLAWCWSRLTTKYFEDSPMDAAAALISSTDDTLLSDSLPPSSTSGLYSSSWWSPIGAIVGIETNWLSRLIIWYNWKCDFAVLDLLLLVVVVVMVLLYC